jgi:RNA polymerase sigma-70 factor (ECF subfamily)
LAKSDDLLLEQARKCDQEALVAIYDRYAEAVYRYLYRLVGDSWIAEDLMSEVFVRLLRSLHQHRGPRTNLPGWLYRVARNLAMDWFREQSRGTSLELKEELVAGGGSPLGRLELSEQHGQLARALQKLTTGQQQVILLRFGEGLRIKKVSEIMGKSEGAVKILQYRAVKRLRHLLQQEDRKDHVHVEKTGRAVRSIPATSSPGRKS